VTDTESSIHMIYLIPTQYFNQLLHKNICMPLCIGHIVLLTSLTFPQHLQTILNSCCPEISVDMLKCQSDFFLISVTCRNWAL